MSSAAKKIIESRVISDRVKEMISILPMDADRDPLILNTMIRYSAKHDILASDKWMQAKALLATVCQRLVEQELESGKKMKDDEVEPAIRKMLKDNPPAFFMKHQSLQPN